MASRTSDPIDAVDPRSLQARIQALAPWFHNMTIGGVRTAPEHFLGDYPAVKFKGFADALPADLLGKSVLDIGCNAGFYAMEMKRRGAGRVVGIDSDARYLAQARLACEVEGFEDVEFRKLDVYDVGALGERFDLVIFMGVFYHLRHPLLALDLIREHAAGDMLLFQSLQRGSNRIGTPQADYDFKVRHIFDRPDFPRLHFIEREYSHDWTNWFIPNAAASVALLRAAGFGEVERIEEEVYLCRVAERPYPAGAVYPARG